MSIFSLIEQEVNLALQKQGDGTAFFDYLDQQLTHPHYLKWIDETYGNPSFPYLGSGKFGWAFGQYLLSIGKSLLVNFPGDLRHQPLVDPLIDPDWKLAEFTYVDNSIYKGRTLSQIKRYVEDYGGSITRAIILYDGTYPPHKEVEGIEFHYVYRWHDGQYRKWEPSTA